MQTELSKIVELQNTIREKDNEIKILKQTNLLLQRKLNTALKGVRRVKREIDIKTGSLTA